MDSFLIERFFISAIQFWDVLGIRKAVLFYPVINRKKWYTGQIFNFAWRHLCMFETKPCSWHILKSRTSKCNRSSTLCTMLDNVVKAFGSTYAHWMNTKTKYNVISSASHWMRIKNKERNVCFHSVRITLFSYCNPCLFNMWALSKTPCWNIHMHLEGNINRSSIHGFWYKY